MPNRHSGRLALCLWAPSTIDQLPVRLGMMSWRCRWNRPIMVVRRGEVGVADAGVPPPASGHFGPIRRCRVDRQPSSRTQLLKACYPLTVSPLLPLLAWDYPKSSLQWERKLAPGTSLCVLPIQCCLVRYGGSKTI